MDVIVNRGLVPRKIVQCRICHDEDEATNMEAPCACSGSLKYAHRRCVQMWCNEKGDTMCEICQQQFKPGYDAPSPRLPFTIVPMHLREPWEYLRTDQYHDPSMMDAHHSFIEHNFDEYQVPTGSIVCCRIIAIIFVALLVLRHTLPIVLNGEGNYSFTLYMLLMLRTIGILLPICVLLKACSIIRDRRRHRPIPAELQFDVENGHVNPRLAAHFIRDQ